jgi:uncharacterized protein YjiS (DUF1127 family)
MLIIVFFKAIGQYLRYRFQLATIDDLDDRTLRDIGLMRSELKTAAWHLAAHEASH